MGKTADRLLRGQHPSRHHSVELDANEVAELLVRYLGRVPSARSGVLSRLIFAIGVAKAEEARCGEGHVSRKDSVASLKAMAELSNAELGSAIRHCDVVTFGRIQDAHFLLMSSEIPPCDTGCGGTCTNIGLPPGGEGPLCLAGGFDGLRRAITLAIDRAITDGSVEAVGGVNGALAATEAGRRRTAGNKAKPHQVELATACVVLWNAHDPESRSSVYKAEHEKHLPPLVRFTGEVFALAGMPKSSSRIVDLLRLAA